MALHWRFLRRCWSKLYFNMAYKNWVKHQLRKLDTLDEELDETSMDDCAEVIYESARRASLEGNFKATQACKIRHGGVAPEIVRDVLAECLSHCESKSKPLLAVAEAAEQFNISKRTLYRLVQDGLPHSKARGAIRIKPQDLQSYLERQPTRPQQPSGESLFD